MNSERIFIQSTSQSNPFNLPQHLVCVRHNPDQSPEIRLYDDKEVIIVSGGLFYYLWHADLGILRIGSLSQMLGVTREKERI